MDTQTSTAASAYTPPWTLRVYDALPLGPVWLGVVLTLGLLGLFFAGRALVDGAAHSSPEDLRIAVTQILMTTYSASAYACVLMTARRTTEALLPIAQRLPRWQAALARVGRHPGWLLPLIGAASYLLVGVTATNATTPAPENPWAWQNWSYDVIWHRATTLLFSWWIGCFCYVTVAESARLSRLLEGIEVLDVLDLDPYRPLIRQGLTNALLVVGVVSVLSLLAVESRYWPLLVIFWIAFIAIAWLGLMLPLRSIRKKIRAAKEQELDWCRQRLQIARDALKSGAASEQPIAEIMAYRDLVGNIRNWPFDNPTLVRFTLYLLIPLGSWLGGALVERGLDLFLS